MEIAKGIKIIIKLLTEMLKYFMEEAAMLKFSTKKTKKAGCVSVGTLISVSIGHYIKEVKSTV